MFEVTFLGHQGWLIENDGAAVLIDPLLTEQFGRCPRFGLQVYPPRSLEFSAFPPLTAVVITHEHDDHFHLPSLALVERTVPVYLSDRISWAARAALARMGFTVQPLRADCPVTAGRLGLIAFAPDHLKTRSFDEWDVVTLYVFAENGEGSFYSSVDVVSPIYAAALLEKLGHPRPAIVTFTNNHTNNCALHSWGRPPHGPERVVNQYMRDLGVQGSFLATAQVVLSCGGGFSFSGPLAELNRTFFPADSRRIAQGLALAGLSPPPLAPLPGERVTMRGGKVVEAPGPPRPFLRPAPAEGWPNRSYRRSLTRLAAPPPLHSAVALGPDELRELMARLQGFSEFLVGGELFCALNSLSQSTLEGRRRAYSLFLHGPTEEQTLGLQYSAEERGFAPAAAPPSSYVAGASCWPRDLLAVLRAESPAMALMAGRLLEWVSVGDPASCSIAAPLWKYTHPLRLTDDHERVYREVVDGLASARPVLGPAAER